MPLVLIARWLTLVGGVGVPAGYVVLFAAVGRIVASVGRVDL